MTPQEPAPKRSAQVRRTPSRWLAAGAGLGLCAAGLSAVADGARVRPRRTARGRRRRQASAGAPRVAPRRRHRRGSVAPAGCAGPRHARRASARCLRLSGTGHAWWTRPGPGTRFWLQPGVHRLGGGEYDQVARPRTTWSSSEPRRRAGRTDAEPVRLHRPGHRRHDRAPHHPELRHQRADNRNEGVVNHDPGTAGGSATTPSGGTAVRASSSATATSSPTTASRPTASTASAPTNRTGVQRRRPCHAQRDRRQQHRRLGARIDGCGCTGGGKFWDDHATPTSPATGSTTTAAPGSGPTRTTQASSSRATTSPTTTPRASSTRPATTPRSRYNTFVAQRASWPVRRSAASPPRRSTCPSPAAIPRAGAEYGTRSGGRQPVHRQLGRRHGLGERRPLRRLSGQHQHGRRPRW